MVSMVSMVVKKGRGADGDGRFFAVLGFRTPVLARVEAGRR